MTLTDHIATTSKVTGPKKQYFELDEHEQSLYEDLGRDVRHKPILKALHRRGTHTFLIAPEDPVTRHGVHVSKLVLDRNETFCNSERLKNVLELVCENAGVTLVSFTPRREPRSNTVYYTYEVVYP